MGAIEYRRLFPGNSRLHPSAGQIGSWDDGDGNREGASVSEFSAYEISNHWSSEKLRRNNMWLQTSPMMSFFPLLIVGVSEL